MTALLIADHDNVSLKLSTAQAVTAALKMTDVVDILVAGNGCEAVAHEAAKLSGVRTVYYVDHPQLAHESPVSEILSVEGPKTFVRGIYAGSLLATVEVGEPIVVATIRTTAFDAVTSEGKAQVEELIGPAAYDGSRFVNFQETKSDRPDLVSAKRVVAGGAGLFDEEGFKVLEGFADAIGAAVGATRTAVDMGLCPNDWQIGQTGKMIAPELYFA